MDATLQYMLPLWLENIAHNENKLRDIRQLKVEKPIARVIIEGTGPSRNRSARFTHKPDTFLIQNQTSLMGRPDLLVLTDAQPVVARKVQQALDTGNSPKAIAMASIVHPAVYTNYPQDSTFGFVHPLAELVKDPFIHLVNDVMSAHRGNIDTFLLQVGCATNAAVLLAIELMRAEILPEVPIILMGVDYAYREVPDESTPTVLSNTGKITTTQFLRYARDLNSIVQAHAGQFTIASVDNPWSLLSEFVPTVNPGEVLQRRV
jgi:hypothetical protein